MSQELPKEAVVQERLQVIFQENFDDESLRLEDHFSAKDIAGWDSLMQVNLVVSIEEEFDVRFSTDEIASISCIGEMKQAIIAKLAA